MSVDGALVPSSIFGWLLRLIVVYFAYLLSDIFFRETGTPRRTALRAMGWVLGFAVFAAIVTWYNTEFCVRDPVLGEYDCLPPGLSWFLRSVTSWLAIIGLPTLIGTLVGLRRRKKLAADVQSCVDLEWPEVRQFLKEKIPEYVITLVFSGGALVIFFLAVMKYGAWGFLIGLAAMIPVAGAGVAVQVLLTLIREKGRSVQTRPK